MGVVSSRDHYLCIHNWLTIVDLPNMAVCFSEDNYFFIVFSLAASVISRQSIGAALL